MKHELTQLCQQVREAHKSRTPLYIQGGNTKSFYGEPVDNARIQEGSCLDMTGYQGIINYQPSELVITARAGTTITEIEQELAREGQALAFEPPRFGTSSTLGGTVASGLSGPRRMAAGSMSDFVLGARLLHSSGELLTFGGEVMKNVAGYDVSRLLVGSLGSLGPIVELSVKVLPAPAFEQTQELELGEAQSLSVLNKWRGLPLSISASAWLPSSQSETTSRGTLYVRVSGSETAVRTAVDRIGGQALAAEKAAGLWVSLRDQTHPFFAQRPLWRIAVPPVTPALEVGSTLIEWNGGLRWVAAELPAQDLRERIESLGGHATLYRYDRKPADVPVFHPLSDVLERINRQMMMQFDPAGIFNPGRRFPILEG